MSVTIEQFQATYNMATPVQKYLCSNPESGKQLKTISEKYDLKDKETYKKFAIAVGDIVLGFYRPEDIANLMQQELNLSPQMSASLTTDIKVFLKPLSDPNWKNPNDTTSSTQASNDINQEILEAEAVLNTIPKPLPRPAENVYTSTQSAILSEAKATPTSVPVPPPSSNTPRWDSEQQ